MILIIRIISILQFLLWIIFIRGTHPWENLCQAIMVVAAGVSFFLSFATVRTLALVPQTYLFCAAAIINLSGILAFALAPVIEGERAMFGLVFLVASGLILLVVVPPGINALLLFGLAILPPEPKP